MSVQGSGKKILINVATGYTVYSFFLVYIM